MSITIASVSQMAAACLHARSIALSAYTLRGGAVRDALAFASSHGARVRVRLERDPLDDAAGTLHGANAASIDVLRAAGADAAATGPGEPVLHMKAAVVDGVAWLDDRNWAGGAAETVLRDDERSDVAAVAAALDGAAAGTSRLRTTKASAQYLEAAVIAGAGPEPLAVESESFGSGLIYNALLHRVLAGRPTRLLVAGREAGALGAVAETERRRLERLRAAGAVVRTGVPAAGDLDEKLAVTAGAAWTGSANATYARGEAGRQRDWGIVTRDAALVAGLRAAFERNWSAARAFAAAATP